MQKREFQDMLAYLFLVLKLVFQTMIQMKFIMKLEENQSFWLNQIKSLIDTSEDPKQLLNHFQLEKMEINGSKQEIKLLDRKNMMELFKFQEDFQWISSKSKDIKYLLQKLRADFINMNLFVNQLLWVSRMRNTVKKSMLLLFLNLQQKQERFKLKSNQMHTLENICHPTRFQEYIISLKSCQEIRWERLAN